MLCKCGCGQTTTRSPRARGPLKKGDYREFVSGHNTRLHSDEEQARRAHFNTGDKLRGIGDRKAYPKIRQKHIHRVVAEQKLGRPLEKGEVVHHIDGDKFNNHPDNIEILPSQSEHLKRHLAEIFADPARKEEWIRKRHRKVVL